MVIYYGTTPKIADLVSEFILNVQSSLRKGELFVFFIMPTFCLNMTSYLNLKARSTLNPILHHMGLTHNPLSMFRRGFESWNIEI